MFFKQFLIFLILLSTCMPLEAKKKKHQHTPQPPPAFQTQPGLTSTQILSQMKLFHLPESLADAIPAVASGVVVDDSELVTRLTKAYRGAASAIVHRGNSMWQIFFDQRHLELHNVFINGSHDQITALLRNPLASELFYGFDTMVASIAPQFTNPTSQTVHAAINLDLLWHFAEAIGAIRLDNPEHYHYRKPPPLAADTIIAAIENVIGQPLIFPNPYPGEHGLATSRGIVSIRAVQSLYQAWRIKQLMKDIVNPKVLEIGGGLGRTAYYANLFGIKDYTIIDLPFTGISSGYFLGRVLGADQVVLTGEDIGYDNQKVKVLTPSEFMSSNETYDLIVNFDGFTEIDPNVAVAYWNKIETSTPIFLSVNHEVNLYTVNDLVKHSGKVINITRYPYWMRMGYAEETIHFQ